MTLRSFIHDLIVARRDGRPIGVAAAYLVLITVVVAPWFWTSFRTDAYLPNDGHAIASLSIATNRALCGTPSAISNGAHVGYLLYQQPQRLRQPIADFVRELHGTVDKYCATVTVPLVNNENSLMLVESWMLKAAPRLSLLGIGRVLLAVRIAMALVFALALLRSGASLLMAGIVLSVAFSIDEALQVTYAYSVYSFLFGLVGLAIGIYVLAFETSNRSAPRIAIGVAAGLVSAFAVNMRTSYLPVFAMLFVIYVWASDRRALPERPGRRVSTAALMCIAFALAYAGFQYAFITRSRPPESRGPSYHVIAHPLVLSLAVPASPLSNREGIVWNDGVGVELAHRIDPSVVYLTPEYEAALRKYYFGLWSRYPAEMRQIYIDKLTLAGRHMIETAEFNRPTMTTILFVLHAVPDGIWLLTLLLAAAAAAAAVVVRRRSGSALAICMVAASGVFLMIECAVIMPYYYLSYGNSLVFMCAALVAWGAQIVVAGVVWTADYVNARRPGMPSISLAPLGEGLSVTRLLLVVVIVAVAAEVVGRGPESRPLHVVGDAPPAHPSQTVDLIGPPTVWAQQAPNVKLVDNRTIVVDGTAEAQYSYLLVTTPRALSAQTYVVASGVLARGGVTVGLQQSEKWVAEFSVHIPGPFRIALKVPADGHYQIVLANDVGRGDLRNTVAVSSLVALR
jgi:hypothetical protein